MILSPSPPHSRSSDTQSCMMLIMGVGKIIGRCGSWVYVDHGAFKIHSHKII